MPPAKSRGHLLGAPVVQEGQDFAKFRQYFEAGSSSIILQRGEAGFRSCAPLQERPKFSFQLGDVYAKWRLRDVKSFRSCSEAELFGNHVARQCLRSRRIPDLKTLRCKSRAWNRRMNRTKS